MSGIPPADPRLPHARAALAELGVGGTEVEVAGHEREVALLRAPATEYERLLGEAAPEIAGRLRELGFRYVALDLAAGDEP